MVTRYKVRLSPRAQTDLNQIVNYLRRKASPRVATQVRKAILETIKTLHTLPESHAIFEEISDEHVVFRKLLKWEYKIVFTVDKEELYVLVVKIYHGKQSQEDIIKELKP